MEPKKKLYVAWYTDGTRRLFDTWADCEEAVRGVPGVRYKGFTDHEEATQAYRGDPQEASALMRSIAKARPEAVNYEAFPEIVLDSLAVDAACSHNPGPVEYRGVHVRTGREIFHVGPYEGGTNNIGEFLALVHGLAWLEQKGAPHIPVYTDSLTARAWLRNRAAKTTLTPTDANAPLREILARAEHWAQTHSPANPILVWDTRAWGEIPADFGRK